MTSIKIINICLDEVKKPNNHQRKIKKHAKGDQRYQLDQLLKNDQVPLKNIFKKVSKFNKSQKLLKKFIFTDISPDEELTLKKFVSLNMNKEGEVEDFEKISKEQIMKYLKDFMDSSSKSYQISARKLSSFEDLFAKMSVLSSLTELKMSIKSNGLVNLDVSMIGQSLSEMVNLEVLTLNLSENVISDIGVDLFFKGLARHHTVKYIDIDISSNFIKFLGAEQIANSVIDLSLRHKRPLNYLLERDKYEINQKKKNKNKNKIEKELVVVQDEETSSPIIQKFYLNLRNNKIEYQGGLQMVEMAYKLKEQNIDISLLMGQIYYFEQQILKSNSLQFGSNCGIINQKQDEDHNQYGFFLLLKKELDQNFEYE